MERLELAARRGPSAARRRVVDVLVCAALALGGLLLLPSLLGYELFVITGDSMTPNHDRGSLLIAEPVPVSALRPGDVITYLPPPGAAPKGLVTHRIAAIGRDSFGRPTIQTKGDANRTVDPWRFSVDGPTQARAVAGVPLAGYAVGALGDRTVRILGIGVPALLIGFSVLAGVWREAGTEARRRRMPRPARTVAG